MEEQKNSTQLTTLMSEQLVVCSSHHLIFKVKVKVKVQQKAKGKHDTQKEGCLVRVIDVTISSPFSCHFSWFSLHFLHRMSHPRSLDSIIAIYS